MNQDTVLTLCRWFKCSESDLLVVAYAAKYGTDAGVPSDKEIWHYAETGEIPKYLKDYLIDFIYPTLCVEGDVCKLEHKTNDTS